MLKGIQNSSSSNLINTSKLLYNLKIMYTSTKTLPDLKTVNLNPNPNPKSPNIILTPQNHNQTPPLPCNYILYTETPP